MIVVDASCVFDILLHRPKYAAIVRRLFAPEVELCAPAFLDVEVCHVLRNYWLTGEIDPKRGREAVDDLVALKIERFPHARLLPAIWQWRANLSAYDAAYVALAEALDAPLATCDKKLAAAVGSKVRVELF